MRKTKQRSTLMILSPYLDIKEVLRVSGRMQSADIPEEYKHQIISPKNIHLVMLLLKDAHSKLLRGWIALSTNYLRSRYWIIGLKQLVKKHYQVCVTCLRYQGATVQPQMDALPKIRISPRREVTNLSRVIFLSLCMNMKTRAFLRI